MGRVTGMESATAEYQTDPFTKLNFNTADRVPRSGYSPGMFGVVIIIKIRRDTGCRHIYNEIVYSCR